MVSNPFAALMEPEPVVTHDEESGVTTISNPAFDVPRGSVFVYDLETVPDESRFPRPVQPEKVVKPDAAVDLQKLVEGTIPNISAKIPILSDGQLEELSRLETAGKNRSGVLKAISEQLADGGSDYGAEFAAWKSLAVNPLCCRVVALGIQSRDHKLTLTAKDEQEERHLIATLWKYVNNFNKRCGYNINVYDDMVLVARSIVLGIDAPQKLDRRKFGNSQAIDLMTVLFPSSTAQKLKDVCRYIGIVPPAGYDMDGSKVLDLVDAGEWDKVAEYVASDAIVEWQLFQTLSDYLVL